MKTFSAIEKLEAVKAIMEILGQEFKGMTVSEAFSMFTVINREVKVEIRCNELNKSLEVQ
jgi:hypothetical protein